MASKLLAAVVVLAAAAAPARADEPSRERVLVWPRAPGDAGAAAEREAAAAGYDVVAFAPIAERLRGHGEAAAAAERDALAAVQAGLDAARDAFLEQRWADMASALEGAEASALVWLARPRHAQTLWELSVQLGIAYLASGDRARALDRFELALAIDGDRRPARELYGPDVAAAFADALARRAGKAPRPIDLAVEPGDAAVAIDGVAVIAGGRGRALREGLHVVRAAAPGYEDVAGIVRVGPDGRIALPLPARAADDPVDRIGPAWVEGTLSVDTRSGRAAILAVAGAAGADEVVVVSRDDSGAVARRLREAGAPARAEAPAAAVRAALAPADVAVPAPPRDDTPLVRKWWLWTGVGVVAAGAVALGVTLSDRTNTVRLLGPR